MKLSKKRFRSITFSRVQFFCGHYTVKDDVLLILKDPTLARQDHYFSSSFAPSSYKRKVTFYIKFPVLTMKRILYRILSSKSAKAFTIIPP